MQLILRSVARDLLENLDDRIKSIAIFNFDNGKIKMDFDKKLKPTISAQSATWIRIYLKSNMYYDFLAPSLTYFITKNNIIMMVSDDTKFVDANYISELIIKTLEKEQEIESYSSEKAIKKYYQKTQLQLKMATQKLESMHSLKAQQNRLQLDMENTYQYHKRNLENKHLLDLMVKQIVSENRDEVLRLL